MSQTLNRNRLAATNRTNKTRNRMTLLFFFLATLTATAFNAPKAHAGCPGHPNGCSKAIEAAACIKAYDYCRSVNPYYAFAPRCLSYITGCHLGNSYCLEAADKCPCP